MQTSGSDPLLFPACGGDIWDAAAADADNIPSLEETARQAATFIQAVRHHRAELAKNCLGAVESIYQWYGILLMHFLWGFTHPLLPLSAAGERCPRPDVHPFLE